MTIGFNSNNNKLNNFLQEQKGKPVTDEIKTKAFELAKLTKGGEKQTGIKDVSPGELKDIENFLGGDVLDKKEQNIPGKASGTIDLGFDNTTDLKTGKPVKQDNQYLDKFANYNKHKNWDPSYLANSVINKKELLEISKKIAKQYNVSPAFLLASFALETEPFDHDIMSRKKEDYYQEDYSENPEYDGYHEGYPYEDEEYGDFSGEREMMSKFPVSAFLVGGLDNENWLKGLPFKKGIDYEIREEVNEHGKIVNSPAFKDGGTCVKAVMMVFAREAGKYKIMAEKENWKNFDQDAPFVLTRLAYNAGPNSKGFKKALDFYKNGEGKVLPHVQPKTNVEKNLEHSLKILDKLKTRPELKD